MDENLLVRIIVPTVDGKARLGTGYPVARDRILTARHVLAQPDRDENQPIQIQWQAADSVAMPPATANVLWQGGADMDAAVLEYKLPRQRLTLGRAVRAEGPRPIQLGSVAGSPKRASRRPDAS